MRRRLQTLRTGFERIKIVAFEWKNVEATFMVWKERAARDQDGFVKAANMERHLRKRRVIRRWLVELQNAKKLKEAENMWRLRTLKASVRKMKDYKNAQLRIPVQQGERKRVVLRKMKIVVLKRQLSRAHFVRHLLRKCFSYWRQYDILLAKNAENFRRRA
eukprot:CAMPEP_0118634366 /NCGR_PEP_ID=MMETSP0785-20121206/1503_1 /TAXON_ID=91992 /ORGANISM="Bolidomonas pacifica, Strain CCMP 1866" /LENGTH=160 /DNA_ID=CAMNT_0006525325 /DNA_START=567 /DNA_END=1045 /DNA_ORIENTATION=+